MYKNYSAKDKLVFIMGGGKFGTKALIFLKTMEAKVLVADVNPNCIAISSIDIQADGMDILESLKGSQAAFLIGKAEDLLLDLLEKRVPDLIVTAIPGNAITKIVRSWFAKSGINLKPYRQVIPKVLENIPKSLLAFRNEASGKIIVSYMNSNIQCRENCMPPKDVCALTGKPRLVPMFRLLEFSVYENVDFSCILISKQLTSGLGAIEGKELGSLLKDLDKLSPPYTLAIGIACDCHGILNLVEIIK